MPIFLLNANGVVRAVRDWNVSGDSQTKVLSELMPGFGLTLGPGRHDEFASSGGRTENSRNRVEVNESQFEADRRTQAVRNALEEIAGHLDGFAGRKNLVWITGGLPIGLPESTEAQGAPNIQPAELLHEFSSLRSGLQALAQAKVAVYPIDARGLLGSPNGRRKP